MKLKYYLLETRPPFLLLPVALALYGTSVAWYDGSIHIGHAVLAFFGLLLAHASCNVLNNYFDSQSGIDLVTNRTPFSGGSGVIREGLLQPRETLWFGIICFVLCIPIGIYFIVVKGIWLLPLLVIGALCIFIYSPVILKRNWPEWSPGLGLGFLPILGMYFVQTGAYTWHAVVAAIIPGILVHNLLLLNEFPDAEADRTAQRRTLPIAIGSKGAGIFYATGAIIMYLWIVGWVIAGVMPVFALLGLLSLPFGIKAIRGALNSGDTAQLMPGMANNVLMTLLTQVLLGIGYIIAIAVR